LNSLPLIYFDLPREVVMMRSSFTVTIAQPATASPPTNRIPITPCPARQEAVAGEDRCDGAHDEGGDAASRTEEGREVTALSSRAIRKKRRERLLGLASFLLGSPFDR